MSTKKLWTSQEQRVVIYHLLYPILYPLPSARAASKRIPQPQPTPALKGWKCPRICRRGGRGGGLVAAGKIDPCINIMISIISHCSTAYLERYFCNFVIFVLNIVTLVFSRCLIIPCSCLFDNNLLNLTDRDLFWSNVESKFDRTRFFAVVLLLNFSSPLVRVSSKFVLVPWYVQSVNESFYIPADIPQKAVYRELASNSAIFSLHVRELFRFF